MVPWGNVVEKATLSITWLNVGRVPSNQCIGDEQYAAWGYEGLASAGN